MNLIFIVGQESGDIYSSGKVLVKARGPHTVTPIPALKLLCKILV